MKDECFLAAANQCLQENLDRGEPVIFASYRLVGAIVMFGGIGYASDRFLGSTPWLLLAGLLVGFSVGMLGLIQIVRRG